MIALAVLVVAGCGVQPTDLPLPGTRVSGGIYTLRVEFASVLNLPARSKVLYDGARVGVLRDVALADRGDRRVALATLDISDTVTIPVGTTAELTQATLLGDFYVALSSPDTPPGRALADGAIIPLSDTTVAPEVEQLLGGIAALANGGTIATLQRVINNANKAFPADKTERDIGVEVLRAFIARTGSDGESIRQIIDSVAGIARTFDANRTRLGFSFDVGPRRVSGAVSAFLGLSNVLNALGPNVVPIGDLVIPRFATMKGLIDVVDPLVATAVRLDAGSPGDLERIRRLMADRIVPLVRDPAVDIVDVTRADGSGARRESVDTRTVAAVLRMIGAMR
ncbi:MlaD family protein [Gordonia sinesedis]